MNHKKLFSSGIRRTLSPLRGFLALKLYTYNLAEYLDEIEDPDDIHWDRRCFYYKILLSLVIWGHRGDRGNLVREVSWRNVNNSAYQQHLAILSIPALSNCVMRKCSDYQSQKIIRCDKK